MKVTNQPVNPQQEADQRNQRENMIEQTWVACQSGPSNLNSLTKTYYQQPEVD